MSAAARVAIVLLLAACGPARPAPVQPQPAAPAGLAAPARVAAKAAPPPTFDASGFAQDAPKPWSPSAIDASPDDFHFVVVTDRTGGHRDSVFEQGADKTRLLKPEFVMSVGDLIEGYTQDSAQIATQWDEFRQIADRFGTRFFYVPGNHDISNPVMASAWSARFGPAYYHFSYKNVLFLCLNTEDQEPDHLSDEQLAYFKRVLADNPKPRWTLVFMHRPLWSEREGTQGRSAFERFEQLLAGRPYTVFAGHLHSYQKETRHDQRYLILATTGGMSGLRGPLFGEFDHVAWVSMTEQGPRVANLLLSGVVDEDVRTPASKARLERYTSGFHVAVDNAYLSSPTYAGGQTHLDVRNETPSAVKVQIAFGPSGALEPVPHALELELQAGAARSVPIAMRTPKPLALGKVPPVIVEWRASFETGTESPIAFSDSFPYVVAPSYELERRTKPVVVDGKLDEWGKLRNDVTRAGQILANDSWTGPDDARYAFSLAYDDNNVYVAIDVVDDRVVAVKERPAWEQDGIELSLDPRDDPERAGDRRDYGDAWRTYAYLAFSPAATRAEMSLWQPEKIPKGVEIACIKTAKGYSAEIALPNAALNALRPSGNWSALRFNLAIRDSDEPGGPNAALWWQPDWHHPDNVPGSGTFRRRH